MTVLNVVNETGLEWLAAVGVVLMAVGTVCVFFAAKTFTDKIGNIGIVVLLVGFITMLVSLFIPSNEIKYEVTIDENVKMVEFYEQYEVIEQRGDIWVIKER